jgi:hypothetical protein
MRIIKFFAFVFLVTYSVPSVSQEINESMLIRMRDSLDNILMVSPTTSAILVRKGEIELYSFNSFLASEQFNDRQGNNSRLPGKQVLFNSLFQMNFGVSKSKRINLGFDINYRAYAYSADPEISTLSLFGNNAEMIRSFTYAGPRVRIQPFRKRNNFIYQAYAWYPIAKDFRQVQLGANKMDIGNTLFYYRYLNEKVGLFTQANFLLRLPQGNEQISDTKEFYIPVSAALSYVLSKKNIFFGALSYSWINNDITKLTEGADSDFIQATIGYQRIVSKRFFVNFNYAHTILARNYGLWNSGNLGIRYLY